MNLMDFFRRGDSAEASARLEPTIEVAPIEPAATVQAAATTGAPGFGTSQQFTGLNDPDLLDFMRGGNGTASGEYVTASKSLGNMAVLRSVSLISQAIGMLPLNLVERGDDKTVIKDHPGHRLVKVKPNGWQTPSEFKSTMQLKALLHGQSFARIVESRGRPTHLIPLDSRTVEPKLTDDWTMVYKITRKDGGTLELQAKDVFHLRDLSEDGIEGMSRVKLAREAIGLALQAQKAAGRLYVNGVMAGGAISAPGTLTEGAIERMRASLEAKYSGGNNAHRWMVLEEGLTAEKWANNAVDAQVIENRNHQIEEVARAFGIPRPLLMMDDTSWGSGIEQLGIFMIQYGLAHWFTAWEQACARSLLSEADAEKYQFKFNERALLRGTLKDQGDFFAKALGAGGHSPWMKQNEVRDLSDLPKSDDPVADQLRNPMTQPRKADEPPAAT